MIDEPIGSSLPEQPAMPAQDAPSYESVEPEIAEFLDRCRRNKNIFIVICTAEPEGIVKMYRGTRAWRKAKVATARRIIEGSLRKVEEECSKPVVKFMMPTG
jgi:hypothetical protein